MSVETVEDDIGTEEDKTVVRWLQEIELSDKHEEDWRKRGKKVIERYRDEKARKKSRFNILWSNTEILKGAIYSNTPQPDVRRRWKTADVAARQTALILERALEYSIDSQPFDDEVEACIFDMLTVGRGVPRERYEPTIIQHDDETVAVYADGEGEDRLYFTVEDDEPVDADDVQENEDDGSLFVVIEGEEELIFEESITEYWAWEDYRISPCKKPKDKRWEAFRHYFTRDELVEQFGEEKGNKVQLTETVIGLSDDDDKNPDEFFKRAEVWEIWNKDDREVIFVSRGYKQEPLDTREDPFELPNFFSTPRALYSVKTNNTMIPIPEFTLYQDLADELENVQQRIDNLIDALRVRGVYDATFSAVEQLLRSKENKLIPVEQWSRLMEKGGLNNIVEWMPIEQIAKVVAGLYTQRSQLLDTIYQITGISDIFRGATDPRETLGAQNIKKNFGSLRLKPRQLMIQRFVREILEIKAHIIANKFEPETLEKMTGEEVTDEVLELIRDDGLRTYRVDIETDSTIAMNEQEDKEEVIEFFNAMTNFISTVGPLVQQGLIPMPVAKEMLTFATRRFKVSRELEDALDQFGQTPPADDENKTDPIEMLKVEIEKLKLQQKEQADLRKDANEKTKLQQTEVELRIKAEELGLKKEEAEGKEIMELIEFIATSNSRSSVPVT